MANQQTKDSAGEAASQVLSPEMMAMFAQFIEQMKKPYVDETAVARKEKSRLELRRQRAESEAQLHAIRESCSHLRENGTNRVAFMQFYYPALGGYGWEGYCQGCGKHFGHNAPETLAQLRVPNMISGGGM